MSEYSVESRVLGILVLLYRAKCIIATKWTIRRVSSRKVVFDGKPLESEPVRIQQLVKEATENNILAHRVRRQSKITRLCGGEDSGKEVSGKRVDLAMGVEAGTISRSTTPSNMEALVPDS